MSMPPAGPAHAPTDSPAIAAIGAGKVAGEPQPAGDLIDAIRAGLPGRLGLGLVSGPNGAWFEPGAGVVTKGAIGSPDPGGYGHPAGGRTRHRQTMHSD